MCLLKTVTLMPISFFVVDFRSKAWSVSVATVHKRGCVWAYAAARTHAGAWRWLEIHLSPFQLRCWLEPSSSSLGSALNLCSWDEACEAGPANLCLLLLLSISGWQGSGAKPPSWSSATWGAAGQRLSPAPSPLFPAFDSSWCWGRRKRNLEECSPCGSFHRPASVIYQLTGNEKKILCN